MPLSEAKGQNPAQPPLLLSCSWFSPDAGLFLRRRRRLHPRLRLRPNRPPPPPRTLPRRKGRRLPADLPRTSRHCRAVPTRSTSPVKTSPPAEEKASIRREPVARQEQRRLRRVLTLRFAQGHG